MIIFLSTLLPLQTDSYAAVERVTVNLAPSSSDCCNPSLLISPFCTAKYYFFCILCKRECCIDMCWSLYSAMVTLIYPAVVYFHVYQIQKYKKVQADSWKRELTMWSHFVCILPHVYLLMFSLMFLLMLTLKQTWRIDSTKTLMIYV